MAILKFAGDQVGAQFSVNEDQRANVKWEIGQTPLLSTDIVRIEIEDPDIGPDGEFDATEVNFLSFTVERAGVVYEFGVVPNTKVKESAGGTNIEQGESYFATNVSISPPASGPFSGLNTQTYILSSETVFDGGPDDYGLRRFGAVDLNGDGGCDDPGETGDGNFNTASAICFTPGVLIATPTGERRVEDLRVGDLMETVDDGPQAVLWIGRSRHIWPGADERQKPILIGRGALGDACPRRDLVVSPQHRLLIEGALVENLFGVGQALAPAKGLTGLSRVRTMRG